MSYCCKVFQLKVHSSVSARLGKCPPSYQLQQTRIPKVWTCSFRFNVTSLSETSEPCWLNSNFVLFWFSFRLFLTIQTSKARSTGQNFNSTLSAAHCWMGVYEFHHFNGCWRKQINRHYFLKVAGQL